jgi:serine/threonine-protein kinase
MSTDVIGQRYRLGSVVSCTPETTTWDARDTWLDERVLVVTPEPGCDERFAALAGAVLDRSSPHLAGLYDIGPTTADFVVFGVPAATLSDEQAPGEEEDVLVAGRALGDALEALHERGVVHGDLHPGSVVVTQSGDATLSPWPLAPRPQNWSGPGGFGSDPQEPRDITARDDVRALGAVLLGALAGPPVLSSEQIANIERELAGRAPNAVAIADRAFRPPAGGGYAVAAELRDDCAAVLAGRPLAGSVPDLPAAVEADPAVSRTRAEISEGRRAAIVLAASGAALFAGFAAAGSIGAGTHPPARPATTHAAGCVVRPTVPPCTGPDSAVAGATGAEHGAGIRARLADQSVAVSTAPKSRPPATVSQATASTSVSPPPPSTTTTPPPSTTTSSSASTTTTSAAPTTTTTAPPVTTTSTSPNAVYAGPSGGSGSWSGPGGGSTLGQRH